MDASQLTPATLRLAGDDLYTHAAEVGLHVDFGDYKRPKDAHEALDSTLVRYVSGSAHGGDVHPGADLSYRLAVVDAAFGRTGQSNDDTRRTRSVSNSKN